MWVCFGTFSSKSLINSDLSSWSFFNSIHLSLLLQSVLNYGKKKNYTYSCLFLITKKKTFLFSHQPIFAITVLCGVMAVFKSYPSASDASLYLALIPIHDELFKCKAKKPTLLYTTSITYF